MHITAAWRAGGTDGRPGWRFQFHYSLEAVETLKATIPSRYREWNEEGKWWWIDIAQEEALLKLAPSFEAFLKQPALF